MRSFCGRDLLGLKDWERSDYFRLFEMSDKLIHLAKDRKTTDLCKDKILCVAFYQPSTRTRNSHEAAMLRLGGHVLGFSDAKMTRAGDFYQESIKDTVHMLEYYGDIIAMRHFQQGAPAEAAKWSTVPIINCGDGWGEHPTQVLTDLYTIKNELGRLDGLNLLCVGDGRMRTMHSMAYAITQFDIKGRFVFPPDMAMDQKYIDHMKEHNVDYKFLEHVEQGIAEADIIYIEPVVQADYTKGRVDSADAKKGTTPPNYLVSRELMRKAKPSSIILHSLPRMDELPADVDQTRHARYWQEAFCGVAMKMGLIAGMLGKME